MVSTLADGAVTALGTEEPVAGFRPKRAGAWNARAARAWNGPYVLLLPFMAVFGVFVLLPTGYAIYTSLFSSGGMIFGQKFVGLANYVAVFQDGEFWSSIGRMLYFGAVQVSVMVGLALALALLIDSGISRLGGVYRVVYFLPYAVPGAVASILWGYMYDPAFGPLGELLHAMGGRSVNFLSGGTLLYSLMNVVTWEVTGFSVMLMLAGLTAVSPELVEAARIDGASEWTIALRVKTPMIRPILVFISVLGVIGSLQLFNEPYVFRSITAVSPTFSPNLGVYITTFSDARVHLGTTMALMLAAVTLLVVGVLFACARLVLVARERRSQRAHRRMVA